MSKNRYNGTTLNNSKIPFIKPIFDDNQFKKGINGSGFFPNGGFLNIIPSQFSPNYNNLRLYKTSKYLGFGDVLAQTGMGAASGGLTGAAAGGISALPGALIGGGIGLVKGLMGESAARKQKKLEDEAQSKADEKQNAIYAMYENMNRQINPQEYKGYNMKSYFNANGGYLFNTAFRNGGYLDEGGMMKDGGLVDGSGNMTLNELIQYGLLKDGGKIHIKESKKGTFTAAASKHGKGVQEFARQVLANKDNYSSAMVKKANFAHNASKWKHEFGGLLPEGGEVANEQIGNKKVNKYTQEYFDMIRNRMNPNAVNLTNKVSLGEMKSGGLLGNPLSDTRSGMGYFINKNRLYAFGGSNTVSLPKQNEVPLDENASIATNDAGTTEGTHETGQNIPVSSETGQTGNYVEPGEVILQTKDGNYALSKRLGFADKYMNLLSRKAVLENNISATDDFSKNAAKRDIDGLEKKINNLPKEQEALKAKLGITNEVGKAAWGDKLLEQLVPSLYNKTRTALPINTESNASISIPDFGFNRGTSFGSPARTSGFNLGIDVLNNTTNSSNKLGDIFNQSKGDILPNNTNYSLAPINKWDNFKGSIANTFRSNPSTNTISTLDKVTPFIDNIANYFLTKATPKIEKPHLNIAPVLETKVDDSAQRNTISDATKAYNKYVDTNVSDVTQRLANRRAMVNESVDKLNTISETTSNAERTARNTNRLYNYQNAVANNALLDTYDKAVTARKAGMLQDYSKNLGNVEENIQELQNRKDLHDYQQIEKELLLTQYQSTTVYRDMLKSLGIDKDDKFAQYIYDKLMDAYENGQGEDNLNKANDAIAINPNVKKRSTSTK